MIFYFITYYDNTHMNTGLPGSGGGEDTITYVIIERII